MMFGKLLRFGRRQLHTNIISREIIKPSSPTPSHLQTYNVPSLNQLNHHKYVPFVLFFPNNENYNLTIQDKTREMKISLSRSLTKYYPFAGRLITPTTPYVDCNDEGVVFVEAKNDSQLNEFQKHMNDDTLEQLFPDDMVYFNNPGNMSLAGLQVTHFACGGMSVAVSVSFVVADGHTIGTFLCHWASVARYGSTDHKQVLPLNPHIVNSSRTHNIQPGTRFINEKHVMKTFVFPNSKISELKKKVADTTIKNPTRVEVLDSLLHKTGLGAATTKTGIFKPSCLMITVDMRKRIVPKLPETTMGGFLTAMMLRTRDTSESSLSYMVAEIQKEKLQHERLQNMQQAVESYKSLLFEVENENFAYTPYWSSSECWFPFYKVDFGWGKPIDATFALRYGDKDGYVLMDTPSGDGIKALVVLDKDEMDIFENDKEMLSFCQK